MNTLLFIATTGLAERLKHGLWTAYGGAIKFMAVVLIVVFFIIPLLMWVKRIFR